jgi:hypothetical protein
MNNTKRMRTTLPLKKIARNLTDGSHMSAYIETSSLSPKLKQDLELGRRRHRLSAVLLLIVRSLVVLFWICDPLCRPIASWLSGPFELASGTQFHSLKP